MSIVIVGGHDRMVAQYKKICKSYKCKDRMSGSSDPFYKHSISQNGEMCSG